MGIVNIEQTPSLPSKPNEGFQLHHPELLIAAAHGDSYEIKRLLLLQREEEDAARQVVLDVVEDTITDDVDKPAATPPSEAVTGAGDSILHVVASGGDGDEFLECAMVIVGKANHLLSAPNGEGDTPLHCAARLKNARMVSHLLALARARDGTGDDESVKAILRMQNGEGETVLHKAVRVEDKDMIGELVSADSQLARVPLTDRASPLYLALLLEAIKKLLKRNKDLTKQADRPTGRTPLHYAALFGETRVTELLLEADPSPAYLPDKNGSFPIHLAASSGQPGTVLALLQKNRCGPYCAQLRDSQGRTFLHVAVQDERCDVVKCACQELRKTMFASSVMNMQDQQGNTALHLAVEVGDVYIVHALLSTPEVKLNLTNKKGETPWELASRYRQKETNRSYRNTRSRINGMLVTAARWTDSPRMNILPRTIHNNEKDTSQSILDRTQIIGIASVLITTVTFAAAFAVPGGYRADGTPLLAGKYAFDAFVMANTLAFIFSSGSIVLLMVAGLGARLQERIVYLVLSEIFLACSARCLGAAFAFGMYAVLAPVERTKALLCCCFTAFALLALEAVWGLNAVTIFYLDKRVLVRRFRTKRAGWNFAVPVLVLLMVELSPYIIIALSGLK
ncbi:hypothetical protein VPH35_070600 [Triticum aestivum]